LPKPVVDTAANWFWDDAQPDSHGELVREAIDALAVFFREIRYSDKPSECDLSSFSVDLESLSTTARTTIEMAENWSYLVRIKGGSKNKNNQKVDSKFQISPMLAPRWGLSAQRGGTIELQSDLANALFDREFRPKLRHLTDRRIQGMTGGLVSSTDTTQTGLFS